MRTIGNLQISGSLITSGSITATTFIGDGSGLTGVTSYTDADTLDYINTLGVVSSSAQLSTEISGAFVSISASLASDISTNDGRLTTLEGKTLISSSAQLSDSTIPGNLTVGGILTAQEFHTEFVSASIIYDSGSTKFGDTQDDIHSFTGSLYITGSVTATNFAGDGQQLTSVLSMTQENFSVTSSNNTFTVTSGSLPTNKDKIMLYYNGQFLNKTYISSLTTDTINLSFSASSGDQIDVIWFNYN
jgi:hypothetical protein